MTTAIEILRAALAFAVVLTVYVVLLALVGDEGRVIVGGLP